MEFYENKFKPSRIEKLNDVIDSNVGFLHLLTLESYDPCLFLNCYHPDRFQVFCTYFNFDGFSVQNFYEVYYEDNIVTFHLYFYSVNLLFSFFRLYEDDYNLHEVLYQIFNGQFSFVTRDECFDILFANSTRESFNVLEPVAVSEQRGLLNDELPF